MELPISEHSGARHYPGLPQAEALTEGVLGWLGGARQGSKNTLPARPTKVELRY